MVYSVYKSLCINSQMIEMSIQTYIKNCNFCKYWEWKMEIRLDCFKLTQFLGGVTVFHCILFILNLRIFLLFFQNFLIDYNTCILCLHLFDSSYELEYGSFRTIFHHFLGVYYCSGPP